MKTCRRKPSLLSRLRGRLARRDARPRGRSFPGRPLALEALEDRIVLDIQGVGLGPLYFFGDFQHVNNTYTATGVVQLGLAPAANESFTPLVDIDTNPGGSVSFDVGPASPRFAVTNASVESIIQGVPTLPVWGTGGSFTFDATALASGGVRLTSGARSFAVGTGNFTPNNIRFADPDGNTADAQVKLQGDLGQQPLDGLSMSVVGDNFVILDHTGVNLTGVQSAVSGSLSLGGLGFSVNDLSVSYSGGQFSLTGSTSFDVAGESVTANFVSPGLVVSNGVVQAFSLALTSNLSVAGLSFTTKDLRVNYTQSTQTYAVTGSASVSVAGESLAVTFGGGGTNGLLITGGTLQSLDVAFQGSFHLLGLEFDAGTANNPLTITYDRDEDQYTASGTVSVPELFGASVTLGTQGQPGLVVRDGSWQLDALSLSLSGVSLGGFTISNLTVAYTTTTFTVALDMWFPGGWKVGGTAGFLGGKLNTIGFDFQAGSGEGIEVGDTGVMITGFSAQVQNLQHPADLVVSGSLTAVWGSASLIQVTGGFTVDRNELDLSGDVKFLDGLGTGSGQLDLDWGTQNYTLDVQLSWYDGTFTFDALVDLGGGGDDLYVKATADVNVPDAIPFIGGKTLAGLNFVLEYHANGDLSDDFVAAWTDINFLFFSVDIGVKVDFTGHVSVIGSSEIHDIDSPPPANPRPQTWTYDIPFSVPQNATQAALQVRWPEAAGTQSVAVVLPDNTVIDQRQFSGTNGLSLVPQFSSSQSSMVGMAGSSLDAYTPLTPGTYTLRLTSDYKFSAPPALTASFHYARPTIAVGAVPPDPAQLHVTVPLSGRVVSTLGPNAHVTLFVDNDAAGYDGSPVADARNLSPAVDAQGNWTVQAPLDLSGLLPLPYHVYAAISDGVNGTVYSAYSAAITPQPPLSGVVTNPKNGQALGGLTVYVDRNNNGQFDPATDPYKTTGATGFYSFGPSALPVGTPFYVGVVIPAGYQVHPGTPSVVQATYDGTQPLTLPFEVDEFTAIQGSVYGDFAAGRRPLAGWTVYLDADGNGRLDSGEVSTLTAADGGYSFHNVPLNGTQTVRVAVAAGYYQTAPAGARTVAVGGDPFTVYENNDFGALPFSTVGGNAAGYGLSNGTLNPQTTPLQGWGVRLTSSVALDAGGGAAGNYLADAGFDGGQTASTDHAVVTRLVTDPAPPAVYQTSRYGAQFGYAVAGLEPGAAYTVRLHFAETNWDGPGDRVFNVAINGQPVLTNFDIFAAAAAANDGVHGKFLAITRSFTATADADGTIALQFSRVIDNAQVNAIEISRVVATTTTDADGNYSFGGLRAGSYTVAEQVPSGWREVAPFTSALNLQYPDVGSRWHLPRNDPQPNSVAVADFNGDGRQDFAVLDPANNVVWAYYNGSFGQPVPLALAPGMNYRKLIVGDFWGTGRQDIAVLGTEPRGGGNFVGRVDVLENTGSGAFTLVPAKWYLLDHLDGYIGDMIRIDPPPGGHGDQLAVIYRNTEGGLILSSLFLDGGGFSHEAWPPTQVPQGAVPTSMAAADLNGDGYTDILISDVYEDAYLAYGTGAGGFSVQTVPGLSGGQKAVMADINGDGLVDLGVFDNNGGFDYAVQDQAGNFTVYSPAVGEQGHPVGAAMLVDVNGDLKPDLVWVSQGLGNQALFVALNTGQAGNWFTPAQQTTWSLAPGAQGALSLAAGDINGDGLTDLVVTDQSAGNVEVVYNLSTTAPTAIPVTVDGNDSTDNNFVNAQLGQVNGRAFEDAARDGHALLGKPAHAGATVYLDLNHNGRLDPNEPHTVTGPEGVYAFSGLRPGTYDVRVVPEPGRQLTTPGGTVQRVTLRSSGPTSGIDFGSTAGTDAVWPTQPTSNHANLTLQRSGDRLELVDAVLGVLDSAPLAGLNSLTLKLPPADPLTIDVGDGGFFSVPGGVRVLGTPGTNNGVGLLLTGGADRVVVADQHAAIDGGLSLSWVSIGRLVIDGGAGDNQFTVTGRPGAAVDLLGGTGNDTYALAVQSTAVRVTDNGGVNALDFSAAGAGVKVNLGLDRGQAQSIGGNNALALRGTIENVTGTRFNDVLVGGTGTGIVRGLGGDDQLLGGAGNNVLVGGAGHNLLVAGAGRDVLIAGPDSGVLYGRGTPGGSAILIGGSTAYDNNDQALRAILAEWASGRSLAQRAANLTNGSGSKDRLNDNYFLNGQTLHAGGSDTLYGDSRRDWFLWFPGDTIIDVARRGRR